MKKRKVFILGGGGFIGFAIAKILADRKNYDLTIVEESKFNEIITLLLPLGNKYIDPLCMLIFDERE